MLRARLKKATNETHERMHAHAGFSAAAAGTIAPAAYRDLLARLYGFHAAFDAAMRAAPNAFANAIELPARARADLLVDDLVTLGAARERIAALPRCDEMPEFRSDAERLGALYVVEGSGLGGKFIAKALAEAGAKPHRFFVGLGEDQAPLFRKLVKALDQLDADPRQADEAERAALATFAAFERWMMDWRGAYTGVEEKATA